MLEMVKSLDVLFIDRQTDWDRIDHLATPKGRRYLPKFVTPQNSTSPAMNWRKDSPHWKAGDTACSQRSLQIGKQNASNTLVFNTSVDWAEVLDDCPFSPKLTPKSLRLAADRRAQLQKLAKSAATGSESDPQAGDGLPMSVMSAASKGLWNTTPALPKVDGRPKKPMGGEQELQKLPSCSPRHSASVQYTYILYYI